MDAARPSRLDLWIGLSAVAASMALMAVVIPIWVPVFSTPRPLGLAPWLLPQASAAILGLAGAALAWRARRGSDAPERTVWRGLALAVAGVGAYVVAMPLLGAIGTGVVLTVALVLARKGPRAWPAALATAAVAVGLAWAMFVALAGTPLPRGPWEI